MLQRFNFCFLLFPNQTWQMMVIKKRKRFSIHNEYLVFFFLYRFDPILSHPSRGWNGLLWAGFFFLSSSAAWIIWVMSINKPWVPGCIYTYLERHLITTPLSQAWVFYNDVCVCILYSLVVVVGIYWLGCEMV